MATTIADCTVVSGVSRAELQAQSRYYPGLILTRTPLRISFAGGGTDLCEFYQQEYGAVFSTAIDKYVYVSVKRHSELFQEPIRVNYSRTEMVHQVHEIENDIARECMRFLQIEPPIYVHTVADVPACTGLGGSSSFAVGLLHALHAYKGERVSGGQLAEEATYIEVDVLKQPIGKQDQYAAAFGGLNLFRFNCDGQVIVQPQRVSRPKLDDLFAHLMIFWTGLSRSASCVLAQQKDNMAAKFSSLLTMRSHAHQLQALTLNGPVDFTKFGNILHQSWKLKRQLADSITTEQIDTWYQLALDAGAAGGKICGAGGGGFLLLIVKPEHQQQVREALSCLLELPIQPEVEGSRILLPFMR